MRFTIFLKKFTGSCCRCKELNIPAFECLQVFTALLSPNKHPERLPKNSKLVCISGRNHWAKGILLPDYRESFSVEQNLWNVLACVTKRKLYGYFRNRNRKNTCWQRLEVHYSRTVIMTADARSKLSPLFEAVPKPLLNGIHFLL